MKAGRRTLRISIAAIAVIGVLAVGVVVLHSPATHRLAVHLHAPHGNGPGTAIVGWSSCPVPTMRKLFTRLMSPPAGIAWIIRWSWST